MKSRTMFLRSVTAAGVALAAGRTRAAAAEASAVPTATVLAPHPPATVAPCAAAPAAARAAHEPSAVARAQAAAMRRFDPRLSDADLASIASGIDGSLAASPLLAGRSDPLRNGDAPATVFSAAP